MLQFWQVSSPGNTQWRKFMAQKWKAALPLLMLTLFVETATASPRTVEETYHQPAGVVVQHIVRQLAARHFEMMANYNAITPATRQKMQESMSRKGRQAFSLLSSITASRGRNPTPGATRRVTGLRMLTFCQPQALQAYARIERMGPSLCPLNISVVQGVESTIAYYQEPITVMTPGNRGIPIVNYLNNSVVAAMSAAHSSSGSRQPGISQHRPSLANGDQQAPAPGQPFPPQS
jgi:hypothetical protein